MKTGKLIALIVGIPVTLFLAPWVIIFVLMAPDAIRKDIRNRPPYPKTLADAVCYGGPFNVTIKDFVDAGESVHQRVPAPPDSAVPLIAHAATCGSANVVGDLLDNGAHADDVPLHQVLIADRSDSEAIARVLVDAGARLDTTSQPAFVDTPMPDLIQAAAYGHHAWLIPILVEHGHDVQIVNERGEGLLAIALTHYKSMDDARARQTATIQALLTAGAHANPRSFGEIPPLYLAATDNDKEALDLLLAAGAHVDAIAPRNLFEKEGAPPDARVTALSQAVAYCRTEAVETLLRHGASRAVVTANGKSLNDGACYKYGYGDTLLVDDLRRRLTKQ